MRIELANVCFRSEKELILQNVNLQISPGSLTLVCGQTGSGKSTLLQLVVGLESPTAGRVVYAGASGKLDQRSARGVNAESSDASFGQTGHERSTACFDTLDQRTARERMAVVFQMPETQLFAATVREDIGYGLELRKLPKGERLQRIEAALRAVGLDPSEFLERSPFLLSGGEKRRVVIAGALVLQPEALILDEPTAGLDPQAQRELLEVLVRLRQTGITLVVATHDLDLFFPLADQVVVLDNGRIAFAGTAQELVEQPDLLKRAGLEPPSVVRIAHRLRQKGLAIGIPLTVEELLGQLEDFSLKPARELPSPQQRTLALPLPARPADKRLPPAEPPHEEPPSTSSPCPPTAESSLGSPPPTDCPCPPSAESPIHRLDPRMKWFAMVTLSLACLSVRSGAGLAAAFTLVLVLFRIADISWGKIWKFLRPLWLMFLLLLAVSAITLKNPDVPLGPIGLSWQGAAAGGLGVARFLLVILLGLLFTETTTGAPLREGFEWAIRPLRKLQVPTRDLSLAVSIALQFVPWILQKIGQLQKALAARGQATVGWRKWTPRQISMLVVPLLISLLKMGDELATAIESRGYDRQTERTAWHPLQWSRSDSLALVLAAAAAGFIWWLG